MSRGVVAVILFAALAAGIYLALYISPPQTSVSHLRLYPQPRALSDVALTDQHGQAFTEQRLQGKWTLTFLGYTYCPDICPTTLAELNTIYPELKALPNGDDIQVLFISVDPNRDSSERLHEYVNYFNEEFIAASGGHEVLFPLVRSMGMMYSLSESTSNPDYLVDHSASIVVINPQGQVIGRFMPENEPGQLPIAKGQQILADMPIIMQ